MTRGWRSGILRGGGIGPPPLVVKLGGSLLTRRGWGRDVTSLLASLPAPRVLVVGGGAPVDGLRAIDRAEPLPPARAHGLAIELMGLTARIAASVLNVPLVSAPTDGTAATAVLDAAAWLEASGRLDTLPVGWHVTSDSIAAVVADSCAAGLVLAKTVPPPGDDLERLAVSGWIDAWFPTAAGPLTHIAWAAPE